MVAKQTANEFLLHLSLKLKLLAEYVCLNTEFNVKYQSGGFHFSIPYGPTTS